MERYFNLVIITLIFTFVAGQIFPHPYLTAVYTVLTAITAVISVVSSRGIARLFGMGMLIIGTVIFLFQQQPLTMWAEGITKNLPLICLVVVVPILGIPIGLGNYQEHLAGLAYRFNRKPHVLYLFIMGLFSLIGPVTNLGALYIVHAMLEKLKLPNELLGRVYVRGFTSVHTWCPYFASVFLVVYSLKIPIYQYLPFGLLLSFTQILAAYYLFKYVEMRHIRLETQTDAFGVNKPKLVELFAFLILLTACIFTFEPLVPLNVSVIISIAVLIFALGWAFYLRLPQLFIKEVSNYAKVIFPSRANEINLMLNAGFFAVVLANTPISRAVHHVWVSLANTSVLLLIMLTIVFIAALSSVGVHHIVTISAIVATVSYDELGIHVLVMAMMLLSAWSVSTTISPVSPVVIGVSTILKEDIPRVTLRWNLLYGGVLLGVHTVVIYGVHVLWLS